MAWPQAEGTYKLRGFKWFTSATDANMTLTLARIPDKDGQTKQVGVYYSCSILILLRETRRQSQYKDPPQSLILAFDIKQSHPARGIIERS